MKTFDYLLSHNIKPSVQRLAIMDYLLTHKTHPSVDEIYCNLSDEIPTLSKTTVYNTLKLFVEQGAALMLTIEEKNTCFDGDTSQHSHFLCKRCGKIYDMHPEGETKQNEVVTSKGFLIQETHQYYKGICPHCAGGKKDNMTN
ncbi:MAG: Fur family transcriptional regulator [Phocaeicola sp.]